MPHAHCMSQASRLTSPPASPWRTNLSTADTHRVSSNRLSGKRMRPRSVMASYRLQPLQGPVEAAVAVPGSKSYTNRALIMAAITKGSVTVRQPLVSDDTRAMLRCLKTLGIECEEREGAVVVMGDA